MVKWLVYLSFISVIYAQNDEYLFEESDLLIEPLELVLRSNGSSGIFYCRSKTEGQRPLTASIDNSAKTSPTFLMRTEQINSTTLRIRIQPNGYIGINRINCHWIDNHTYPQTADLVIGDHPGVIQLKERCIAYDRRYIQCIFRAPIIARAFQNGFPRFFNFTELNAESSPTFYRSPAKLVRITDGNELVFHFEPRDRLNIPKRISMKVSITLRRFNTSTYFFTLDPSHTTIVDYQIEDISSTGFTIRINHNNTGTIYSRLCTGRISQVDEQEQWALIQDIPETIEQKISTNGLRPSKNYEICLRCYYEQTDQSYKDEICTRIRTKRRDLWFGVMIIVIVPLIIIFTIVLICIRRKKLCCSHVKNENSGSSTSRSPVMKEFVNYPSDSTLRYTQEPTAPDEERSFLGEDIPIVDDQYSESNNDKYLSLENTMKELLDTNRVSPDTVDLTRRNNPTQ